MSNFLKAGGIVVASLSIAMLGISASSLLTPYLSMSQQAMVVDTLCPSGMTSVSAATTYRCVDTYEASTATDCPITHPQNSTETQVNINRESCKAVSKKGVLPWVYISREQAKIACIRAGKRLPTAAEWYAFALGTPQSGKVCNIDGHAVVTTASYTQCISALGIYDTVGNVWEWVSDDVIQGTHHGRPLPEEGFVQQVADDGIATVTGDAANADYGTDYFWTEKEGVYGMLRGGFYRSGDDAGVYAVQAKTPPHESTVAIGFRCVL